MSGSTASNMIQLVPAIKALKFGDDSKDNSPIPLSLLDINFDSISFENKGNLIP